MKDESQTKSQHNDKSRGNDLQGPVEIAAGVYWIGSHDPTGGLQCNPYLVIDDGEGVLIDPGSLLDVDIVHGKLNELCPLEQLKYLVASHQDPDLCAAIPEFERRGATAHVATHWRSSVIIKYYDFNLPFYLVNHEQYRLTFGSDRELRFIPAPYLHFPGTIMTYDPKNRILFSGDLFAAFSTQWSFFADENYVEPMLTFHEHYMPGNEILRPVMELLLQMEIDMIAPQHGSIIKENVRDYIVALRDLECGTFLKPVKKELSSGGGYLGLCQQILRRLGMVYGAEEVRSIFEGGDIQLADDKLLITEFNSTGPDLWEEVFRQIYMAKGTGWIGAVEPFVQKLAEEYQVPIPEILQSTIYRAEAELEKLSEENIKLKELNARLEANLKTTEVNMIRDSISGLYNERFFREFIKRELESATLADQSWSLCLISIDNAETILSEFGEKLAIENLVAATYILKENIPDTYTAFKMDAPAFVLYMPDTDIKEGAEVAESIRLAFANSESFIRQITVSVGVVSVTDFPDATAHDERFVSRLVGAARMRLLAAIQAGMNAVAYATAIDATSLGAGKAIVLDSDRFAAEVLAGHLRNIGLEVVALEDGMAALELMETATVDMVITELVVPKLDAFGLRQKMLESSKYKNIPFIILSQQKNEKDIKRAFSLGIEHFLKKPYFVAEVLGIAKSYMKMS